jgi:hypothetical protein
MAGKREAASIPFTTQFPKLARLAASFEVCIGFESPVNLAKSATSFREKARSISRTLPAEIEARVSLLATVSHAGLVNRTNVL